MSKMFRSKCIFLITVLFTSSVYPSSEIEPSDNSESVLQSTEDSAQHSEIGRAGPFDIKPPSQTTEKPSPSTEPPGIFGSSGGTGGGLPSLPGGSSSGGQAIGPTLVLGAFQAIITPFDPSMLGSLVGALGGSGGLPSLPGFPTGGGSKHGKNKGL